MKFVTLVHVFSMYVYMCVCVYLCTGVCVYTHKNINWGLNTQQSTIEELKLAEKAYDLDPFLPLISTVDQKSIFLTGWHFSLCQHVHKSPYIIYTCINLIKDCFCADKLMIATLLWAFNILNHRLPNFRRYPMRVILFSQLEDMWLSI